MLTYKFRLYHCIKAVIPAAIVAVYSLCFFCLFVRHQGYAKKLLNQFSQNSVEGWHMEWTTELADDFSGNLGRCVRFMVTAISK